MKKCSLCKMEFPATTDYFYRCSKVKSGLRSECKKCSKEKEKNYADKYYIRNKERKRESQKKRIQQDHDKYSKIWKEYNDKNKTKIAKRKQLYYQKNKEHIVSKVNAYRIANKEKVLLKNAIYKRGRLKTGENSYTIEEWKSCKGYFNNSCAYCGERNVKLEKEHFIPFTKGGEYSAFNIIPACKHCNCSKHNSNFSEWYPRQEFYSKKREQKIFKYLNYKNNTQQLALL